MNDIVHPASRPAIRLARALLAVLAAAMMVGSAMRDANAAVSLVKFEARWQTDGSILVEWVTSSELDTSDFFLYRTESQNGPGDDYIDWEPALGDGFTGAAYSFVDEEVSPNGTYYYYLEEVTSDSSSNYFGPIAPTGSPTNPATNTPTATRQPDQGSQPTATRQYTNTPRPSGTGTIVPTQTQRPAQSRTPLQAAPTRSSVVLVTSPTPVGGAAPTVVTAPPTPAVTATPESGQIQPTASPTATETPSQQAPRETLTPSPTTQRLAAAPKETSQPLLDASAIQISSERSTEAPQNTASNSRPVLLFGGGALLAAAILGALALLIWRWRAG